MTLQTMALCNVPLDFDDSGVNFDFNDLPERCSSASISGSSSASSSFGPHTPTSDRSTPFFSASLDFSSSFASSVDTVPFDLTPPSSAASNCFPVTPRGGNVTDFGYSGFPVTPSRGQIGFSGHPFSNCSSSTQLAPSQTMDCGSYPNHLGASPFMSTPSSVAQFDHSCDMAWMHTDSPISFENDSSSSRLVDPFRSAKPEAEGDMMSPSMRSSAARKRAVIGEARHKTTALHQAQQRPQPNVRRQIKKERRIRSLETEGGSMAMSSVEPSNRHYCPEEGCNKGPYQRKEHLKRHIDSIHNGKMFKCKFCNHRSNRSDNLQQHLKLHTRPERMGVEGKRGVDYHAGAVREYEEVQKRNRARRRPSSKDARKPSAP
ncbi:uncharacterized protein B0T15DRAFT_226122 [Chaetomium strumarium]|uniref:C2H2-type domain-containing protein n=1 Tax=Chaetomium strumarium TaxID=1170767 RepID=A0AAJ0GQ34_9PEZI|nr:hypothetical protein B0T15DRAFT_226122 [Chaetomium strumarium]